MKNIKLLITLFMVASSTVMYAQATLEIEVANIREAKGLINASLFTDESSFLKKQFAGKILKASGKTVVLQFDNLPVGNYALSIIHDENENGELDKNFMGIPKEGFAFGNNALGTFGPPNFNETLIKLKEGISKQSVTLKYY